MISKPVKSCVVEDSVYNFIKGMIEESKYYDKVKVKFNKKFVITEEDNEDFKNSTKYLICENNYVDGDVNVRDYCHITAKCRGYTYRDWNINVKLNYKIYIVFYNLKSMISTLLSKN